MENQNNNGTGVELSKKAKYAILAAAAVVIIAIIAIVVAVTNSRGGSSEGGSAGNAQVTEEAYYTPVMMYFVSKNDEGYNDYMTMIDELKAEYDGRVTFDIVDVDENPEAKENFPTEGNTPLFIMNDTTNTITSIRFKCADKELIKGDIDAAL